MTDFYDSEEETDIEVPEIFRSENTIREQQNLMNILAPYAHTYYYVAQSLKLLNNTSILETEFVKIIISDIKKNVDNSICPYGKTTNI